MTHDSGDGPRALMAWSSGKDALWALHLARKQGIEVAGLLTTITDPYRRVSMHGVREELVHMQARALSLPLWDTHIPAQCTNEIYDTVMADTMERAKAGGITGVIFGDIHLAEVRAYREERLARADMQCHLPLWGRAPAELAREMIAGGVRAYVTCLDPRKLPREFAGRVWDASLLAELPAGLDPCGENGEFHTFAFAGPGLAEPIAVVTGETVEREGFVFTDLTPA